MHSDRMKRHGFTSACDFDEAREYKFMGLRRGGNRCKLHSCLKTAQRQHGDDGRAVVLPRGKTMALPSGCSGGLAHASPFPPVHERPRAQGRSQRPKGEQ